jgi:hypothetical protein
MIKIIQAITSFLNPRQTRMDAPDFKRANDNDELIQIQSTEQRTEKPVSRGNTVQLYPSVPVEE